MGEKMKSIFKFLSLLLINFVIIGCSSFTKDNISDDSKVKQREITKDNIMKRENPRSNKIDRDISKENSLDAEIQKTKNLFKEIEQMNPEELYAGVSVKVGKQFRRNELVFIKALKTSSSEMRVKIIGWVVQDCEYLNLKEIKTKTELLLSNTTIDQQEREIIKDIIKAFDEKLKSKEGTKPTGIKDLVSLMKVSKSKDGAFAEAHAAQLGEEFRKDQYSFIKAMSNLSKEDQKAVASLTAYNCNYFDLEALNNETKKLFNKNITQKEKDALKILIDEFERMIK